MVFGIAEELIRLSVKYCFDNFPEEWGGKGVNPPRSNRYTTDYSPTVFALALEQYVAENGVKIRYDTRATYPLMEENTCLGIICESINGREFFGAKAVIDATGDATIMHRAGVPTVAGKNYTTYVAHYYDKELLDETSQTGNLCKFRRWIMCGSDMSGNGQPQECALVEGTDADFVTEYIIEGKRRLFEKIKNMDRESFDIMALSAMPHFRTIRRIVGDCDFEAVHEKEYPDSIGTCGDFRLGGKGRHFHIPAGALKNKAFPNLFAAGRIISAPQGDPWEITRVIPVCALTGEGAGKLAIRLIKNNKEYTTMAVIKKEFGKNSKGETAYLYEISNASGMKATVSDFGATLVSVHVTDKDGKERDVVWGCDTVQDYEGDCNPYFGACVGRIANRVANAVVTVNGKDYYMDKNDNGNCLHSGNSGYHVRMWNAEVMDSAVKFSILSPDGDQGLPGNFQLSVTYTLTEENGIHIAYDGVCDQDTYVSLTNHSYFNLEGENSNSILDHEMWIDADAFTMVDEKLIPTGELVSVEGTALDFRTPKAIGRDIDNDETAIRLGGGYDHNWALNSHSADQPVVRVTSEKTGISMEVYTDCPGIQFYSGNFLTTEPGKGGRTYPKRSAIALETQNFPDSMHHANFPDALLKAGEKLHTETEYRFSTNTCCR